jgi:hypothetical protein
MHTPKSLSNRVFEDCWLYGDRVWVCGFDSGLVPLTFWSLSSNVCYEGDMEWQRDIQTSFGVMRCASRSAAA